MYFIELCSGYCQILDMLLLPINYGFLCALCVPRLLSDVDRFLFDSDRLVWA